MSETSQNKSSRDMVHHNPSLAKSNETKPLGESYTLLLEMETQQILDIQTLPEKPRRKDGVDEGWQRKEKNLLESTRPEFEMTPAIAKLR